MNKECEYKMSFYLLKQSMDMFLKDCLTNPLYLDEFKEISELYALVNELDYDDNDMVKITYNNGQWLVIPE